MLSVQANFAMLNKVKPPRRLKPIDTNVKRVLLFTDLKSTSLSSSEPQWSKTNDSNSELLSTEANGRRGWSIKDSTSFRGLVQQFISLTNASEGNFDTMLCLVVFLFLNVLLWA